MCQAQMFTRVSGTFRADVGGCLCAPQRQNHTSLSVINLTHTDMYTHTHTNVHTWAYARMFGHMFLDGRTSADTLTQQSRPVYMLLHTDAGAIHYLGAGGSLVDKRITQCSCPLIFKGAVHPAYKSSCAVMVKVVKGQHVCSERDWLFVETVSQNIDCCKDLISRCLSVASDCGKQGIFEANSI